MGGPTGRLLADWQSHRNRVFSVAWAPDGRCVASEATTTVKVGRPRPDACWLTVQGHRGRVESVAWAPDGRCVASGSDDRTVKVWEAQTGRLLADCQGHEDEVEHVAWAPDGRCVASGSVDGTVKVWEVATGRCVSTLLFDWAPKAVEFLPTQPLLLVVADEDEQCFGYEVVGNLGASRS